MPVTETISSTYSLDNAMVYERSLNGNMFALHIVPNENYVLLRVYEEYGETTYYYTAGSIAIPTNQIATAFPQISAVLRADVPEGSFINGLPEPTETI